MSIIKAQGLQLAIASVFGDGATPTGRPAGRTGSAGSGATDMKKPTLRRVSAPRKIIQIAVAASLSSDGEHSFLVRLGAL